MSNQLAQIIEVVKEKQTLIKEGEEALKGNEGALPVSAVRVKTGHIKRAKLDLIELYRDYRKALQASSLFIIVTGKGAEKYVNIAEENFGCFSSDAEVLYRELLDKVPERLYINQTASSALFDFYASKFEDRALEIDIIGYPPLLFESKFKKPLRTKEDALDLMKRAFNDKIGSEVIALDALDRVTEKAVTTDFAQKHCPIILYTQDPLLVSELIRGIRRSVTENVFVVSTGKVEQSVKDISLDTISKVTDETVKSSLLKIKERLK